MRDVAEVFREATEYVIANSSGDETRLVIRRFMANLALAYKPYMITTPEGTAELVQVIFGDEILRDFVLSLGYVFYSRWGVTSGKYTELVQTIAWSAAGDTGIEGSRDTDNYIPQEIKENISVLSGTTAVLLQNKWLITILLIQLFVEVAPVTE